MSKIGVFMAVAVVEMYFPGYKSLKERRGPLKSLMDRLRKRGFSVAVVGPTSMIQRAWIAVACISGSASRASSMIDGACRLVHDPRWETIGVEREVYQFDDMEVRR